MSIQLLEQKPSEMLGVIRTRSVFMNCITFRAAPGISQPSENPTFTLFYFNVKALAEPIRFLFAYGGQEYEDVRVTRDEWPALKPST